jgi:hypothetical protein
MIRCRHLARTCSSFWAASKNEMFTTLDPRVVCVWLKICSESEIKFYLRRPGSRSEVKCIKAKSNFMTRVDATLNAKVSPFSAWKQIIASRLIKAKAIRQLLGL